MADLKKRYELTKLEISIAKECQGAGLMPGDVAAYMNISLENAQRLFEDLKHFDVDALIQKYRRRGKRGPARGFRQEEQEVIMVEIRKILRQDCMLKQEDIMLRLPKTIKCCRASVGNLLTAMHMQRKPAEEPVIDLKCPRLQQRLAAYASRLASARGGALAFVEEAGFSLHLGPQYGYAPEGETLDVTSPRTRGKAISMVMAVIEKEPLYIFTKVGRLNEKDYIQFASEMCSRWKKVTGRKTIAYQRSHFAFPNVLTSALQERLAEVEFVRLPEPSPTQLNPVQGMFAEIKCGYRMLRRKPKTDDDVMEQLHKILAELEPKKLPNLHKQMWKYLDQLSTMPRRTESEIADEEMWDEDEEDTGEEAEDNSMQDNETLESEGDTSSKDTLELEQPKSARALRAQRGTRSQRQVITERRGRKRNAVMTAKEEHIAKQACVDMDGWGEKLLEGYGALAAELCELKKGENPDCVHCGVRESTLHVIFHCPRLNELRVSTGLAKLIRGEEIDWAGRSDSMRIFSMFARKALAKLASEKQSATTD